MSTFLDVDGDPNEVSATGALLRSMAQTFKTKVQGPLADINAIDAERPWGADHFGEGFEHTYNYTPEGTDQPLRDSVRDGMSNAGDLLTRVGDGTVLAMTEYQGTDVQNASDITTANDA
ncbi:hypothetical protein [Protofrankia symbiont of Coriaria ruscifolia]|uniref:hypothetical protein n=1 Tax=Protofrankia symbiont of Coriaria ruscifolia TaxID=1306542 RepID=UPI0010418795|nr:hypothetical protein [Protofrankia symbiont of Coriaria ruscifolia]